MPDRRCVGVRVQKNLKSKILSLIATVICLTIALSCFSLPVLATTGENEDNALMVGVPADRCPVFYQDADTGEIVGIGVDLMRAVAENAGYDVSFICVEEPTLKEALDNEAYDIVMPFGSAVPSASGKPSIVTDNLIQTPFTLVTEGNGDLPQLNELHVGMLHSLAAGAETVQQLYPGMEITLYETMPECVKALRAGEVDALLHNSYVWSYVLQKTNRSLKILPVLISLSDMFEPLCLTLIFFGHSSPEQTRKCMKQNGIGTVHQHPGAEIHSLR